MIDILAVDSTENIFTSSLDGSIRLPNAPPIMLILESELMSVFLLDTDHREIKSSNHKIQYTRPKSI